MKGNDIVLLMLGIFIFLTVSFGGYNFVKLYGYEEVCIAQRCTEWAYGDDWIKDNCQLENNQYTYCNVVIKSQNYKVPLEEINLSQARSCRESECFTSVYVKTQEVK